MIFTPMNIFKITSLAGVLLFASCQSKSQNSTSQTTVSTENIDKNQVTWNPSIDYALAQAKASGKLLFVECYSPTCPVCQSIEPFFKKTEVATKYNSSFVNYKLDVGNAEQVKFLNARNIYLPSFPQFLYFDGDGKIVHQAEVTPDVKTIVTAAETALSPDKRAANYKARFDKGDRSLDLLVQLAAYARLTKDTTLAITAADEVFKIYPKDQLNSETSWKLTKKCVTDMENGFAVHWFNNVATAAAFEKKDGHAGNENNILGGIIQSSLYSQRGQNYGTAKLNLVKKYMNLTGAGQYIENVTWEFDTKALIREGKPEQALAIGEKMAAKFGTNGQSLVYIARVFNDFYPNKNYAPKATAWLNKAKGLLKEDKFLAEYYFESAKLNQKAGDLVKAKADAQQARNLASKAQVDLAKFSALIEKL
jgi:thiol-disulfide isomerase/thioredoxin